MKKMLKNFNLLAKSWIILFLIKKIQACGSFGGGSFGGGGGADSRIRTNPSFTWTMNPPVAWTYPTPSARIDQSFFPGQPLTQTDAQNQADGDIKAAVFEGLNSIGISSVAVRIVPNYQPQLVSDCVKATSRTQTAIGEPFGIVEQGAVIYTATSTVAIPVADCQAHSFSIATPLVYTPYIQKCSVNVEGISMSGFQAEQLANAMMVSMNFNKHVRFVTEIKAD